MPPAMNYCGGINKCLISRAKVKKEELISMSSHLNKITSGKLHLH